MTITPFQKEIYVRRRQQLVRRVGSGILLFPGNGESPVNYPSNSYRFRQDSDFLYFFGPGRPGMAGLIDADSGEAVLFGDDFSTDEMIWSGPASSVRELAFAAGIDRTAGMDALPQVVEHAKSQGRPIRYLPPYRGESILRLAGLLTANPEEIRSGYSVELIRAVVSLREIKEPGEIAEIERSIGIAVKMHQAAMKMCGPGITEREIAGTIEGIALSEGAGVAFPSIVTQHGEVLHNHDYGGVLEKGRLLLIDAGAEGLSGYASDVTRTFPVAGKFWGAHKDLYEMLYSVYRLAFDLVRPGIPFRDVHLKCAGLLSQGLKDLGLLRGAVEDIVENGAYALFMPHGIGHQMGLDVHDMEGLGERYVGYNANIERDFRPGLGSLRMGRHLMAGHVLTVEPGVYFISSLMEKWRSEGNCREFLNFSAMENFVGFGGIRIEDDVLVTDAGCRILGAVTAPVTVEEIEEYMAG